MEQIEQSLKKLRREFAEFKKAVQAEQEVVQEWIRVLNDALVHVYQMLDLEEPAPPEQEREVDTGPPETMSIVTF